MPFMVARIGLFLHPNGDDHSAIEETARKHIIDIFDPMVLDWERYVPEFYDQQDMPDCGTNHYVGVRCRVQITSFSQRQIDQLKRAGDYLGVVLLCDVARATRFSQECPPELFPLIYKTMAKKQPEDLQT